MGLNVYNTYITTLGLKMEHKITVVWEQIEDIIVQEMKSDVENLKVDLENRKAGYGLACWEHDLEADVAMIEKHIEALELIVKYYGG